MTDLITGGSTAAKTGVFVYKNRHRFHAWWKMFMVACSFGKTQVLVLGRSGVGKSVLTSSIHGEANELKWQVPGISKDIEIKPILFGEWTKIVTVLPGQDITERNSGIHKHFSQNKLEGLIYVVDWGFTDIRSEYSERQLVQEGYDSLEKIREYHLKQELSDFRDIIQQLRISLSANNGPEWLMIAITKFDLFSDDHLAAKAYYEDKNGEFYSIINELLASVGSNNLKINFSFVTSRMESYRWNGVDYKSKLSSSTLQRNCLVKFINDLAEISI